MSITRSPCLYNEPRKVTSAAIPPNSAIALKMSFGVSVSDIITVISLAKDTVQYCRHAPSDFAEASRVSQSLYLMLEGVKTEYQNPDSPLHKDERTRIDFAIHFKNCERSLKPLAELIIKHKRLATSNIRIIDRVRFPKKDYLESRGDLAFYTARLSEFLQMVGLGSLGRIEHKIEEIKGDLPILMSKLDQMCAEFRIVGDKESLLSDHTGDEKFVWKTFRSKLNEAGFTSNVLREHEAAIFLRIRELTKCGLLDTDGSNSFGRGDEFLSSPPPVYRMPFRSNSKKAPTENEKAGIRKEDSLLEYPAAPKKATNADDSKDEPIDLRRRTRPTILVGKRTRTKIRWAFRKESSKLPQIAPSPSRSSLTSDLLPSAAGSGDLKRVKYLLASGEHIESKGPESWTEETTTYSGDPPMASTTYTRHSHPETTALYRAAYAGWFDIVHFLISQGADVNTKNGWDGRQGEPILFDVIRHGDRKMAQLLLEYEAHLVQSRFDRTTALHVACSYPKRALVRLVLDYGAYIDARDSLGQTPLYLASLGGFASVVELLLEEGARVNVIIAGRRTALYKSGGDGRCDVVELLLRYGADPDLGYGRLGETKLYKAAWYNEMEVVELLLRFEADVNIRNRKKMEYYRGFSEKVIHGVLSGLSKEHAIMNAWGKSALHAAAYRGHEDMVQVLLSAGADREAVGNDRTTPLYLAAQKKHKGVVQILLNAGAQLQTERHDPVLALIDERNKEKNGGSKELIKRDDDRERQIMEIGSSDFFVGLVADVTKVLSSSRRLAKD